MCVDAFPRRAKFVANRTSWAWFAPAAKIYTFWPAAARRGYTDRRILKEGADQYQQAKASEPAAPGVLPIVLLMIAHF